MDFGHRVSDAVARMSEAKSGFCPRARLPGLRFAPSGLQVLSVKKRAFPAENELTPAPSDRRYHARALLI
jgi:hypothetical protein